MRVMTGPSLSLRVMAAHYPKAEIGASASKTNAVSSNPAGPQGERPAHIRRRQLGQVDFDSLYDRVLADMPEPWTVFREDGCSGEVTA
jgi:hypothetical protein